MNYIAELAYSTQVAHATKTAKDKRQKNKYNQTPLLESEANFDKPQTSLLTELNKDIWQGEDRRSGNDRRQDKQDRGRYVESRQRKNRRYQAELSLTI
ncbi:MAG: hypothetical protein OQK09_02350 [Colwellia sp.]|nr:hypothetical protein [Colwellia sp.]MCW8865868.1 hypothetical protein [Colwellia sp.]MCW9080324.1 hypothetical protein [Colwellia sp.]